MATNILSNKAYNGQEIVYSSEVSNISAIDITAILADESTGHIRYTVQRKTANSAWRDAKDENGQPLSFSTIDETDDGINIVGLNAAKMRVKVEIISGAGTLNLEYESI